jgi:hypothetical protein
MSTGAAAAREDVIKIASEKDANIRIDCALVIA